MKGINPKAWNVLRDNEKMALSLKHIESKSSWQAGEIMERSHYKYLEIEYRAGHLLKLFTTYYKLYAELIVDGIRIDPLIKHYLIHTIERREKPMDALESFLGANTKKTSKQDLNEKLIECITLWGKGESIHEQALFNLVKEFDRWNNFRILPKQLQEPSAYKRRLKNVQKRRVRLACSLPELSVEKIEQIFVAKKKPYVLMPILVSGRKKILKIKNKPKIVEVLSDFNLYMFEDLSKAERYLELIHQYMTKKKRECQDGLNFWPEYRDLIRASINFETIDNIVPSRRFLKMALSKHEFY